MLMAKEVQVLLVSACCGIVLRMEEPAALVAI